MLEDNIVNFYKNTNLLITKRDPLHIKELIKQYPHTLVNHNHGVGDSLMLYLWSSCDKNTYNTLINCNRNIPNSLKNFNNYIPSIFDIEKNNLIDICDIQSNIDCGGGHFLQKIQHICGIDKQLLPRPILINKYNTIPNMVVMSFDKGQGNQTSIHPRARLLYPEHKSTIQKFINNNLNKYTFVEVGKTFSELENVLNKTNQGIEITAKIIAECDYYFAMHNGLTHIAAGLNKKSIIIVNFPSAKHIYLPCLREICLQEISWLYPQNVHLHQDDEGELVKFLNYNNIERAFNGEIYPFFSEKYLTL
jgi:hypothetical protein